MPSSLSSTPDASSSWSLLLAKGLGILIIAGACLNKAPVIRNLLHSRSSAGFTRSGALVDLIMVTNSSLYSCLQGYPLTAYGENVVLVFQCLVVLLLVYRFSEAPVPSSETRAVAAGLVLYPSLVWLLLPAVHRHVLVASSIPLTCYSSGSAILEARRLRHTGSQSAVTISLNLTGSVIRIITTIQEVGYDYALLAGYALGTALCIVQLAQITSYRSTTRAFLEQKLVTAATADATTTAVEKKRS